jgi:hypothetical protein
MSINEFELTSGLQTYFLMLSKKRCRFYFLRYIETKGNYYDIGNKYLMKAKTETSSFGELCLKTIFSLQ